MASEQATASAAAVDGQLSTVDRALIVVVDGGGVQIGVVFVDGGGVATDVRTGGGGGVSDGRTIR